MATLSLVFGSLLAVAVGAGLVGVVWSTALWWGRLWAQRPWSARWRATQVYLQARGAAVSPRLGPLAVADLVSAVFVLSLLLGGAWEFGRACQVQSVLDAGCAQAADYLVRHPDDPAAAAAIVRRAAAPALGDDLASRVQVTTWGSAAEVSVRAAVPWSSGLLAPLFSANQTIAGRHSVTAPTWAQGVSQPGSAQSAARSADLSVPKHP